jgi:hypothetical protein
MATTASKRAWLDGYSWSGSERVDLTPRPSGASVAAPRIITPADEARDITKNDIVELIEDLPGVPAGTLGKVLMVTGFTWIRFNVLFTNSVNVGQIDRAKLRLLTKAEAKAARKARRAA